MKVDIIIYDVNELSKAVKIEDMIKHEHGVSNISINFDSSEKTNSKPLDD